MSIGKALGSTTVIVGVGAGLLAAGALVSPTATVEGVEFAGDAETAVHPPSSTVKPTIAVHTGIDACGDAVSLGAVMSEL